MLPAFLIVRVRKQGNASCCPEFLRTFPAERIPQSRLSEPEGTCFAWPDAGRIFGQSAGQFQRIVPACPRATLRQAPEHPERAVAGI